MDISSAEVKTKTKEAQIIDRIAHVARNILYKHPECAHDTVIYYWKDANVHISYGLLTRVVDIYYGETSVFRWGGPFPKYIPGEWEEYLEQLEAAL